MAEELFMRGVKAETIAGNRCAVFFYPDTQEFFVMNWAADAEARAFAKSNGFVDGVWPTLPDKSAQLREWLSEHAAATGSKPIDGSEAVTLSLTPQTVDSVVRPMTVSMSLAVNQKWTTWIQGT